MTEKNAQGNPNSPEGWGVQEVVDPDAHPNGELLAIEEQKRQDTAAWEDSQNRRFEDGNNPAQAEGWGVHPASAGPEIVSRVFQDRSAHKLTGAKVLLGTSQEDHQLGEIVARKDNKFWVAWRDGADTIESMDNYELVIREDES